MCKKVTSLKSYNTQTRFYLLMIYYILFLFVVASHSIVFFSKNVGHSKLDLKIISRTKQIEYYLMGALL